MLLLGLQALLEHRDRLLLWLPDLPEHLGALLGQPNLHDRLGKGCCLHSWNH